ncbi:hypothetical protein [Guptibacillus algicola]|uniref:hypothetical protein n=1 Tax=Guptibacillus algicola TaxID=225844 RepID=UPI001CD64B08|nr:hypothetical protein [Alkalihalobacillus algicola]MCA0986124.1 hypothetical protein [Alkalihalobacillus algicola]
MIKSIFILILIIIGVAGCETIYESKDLSPYGSREYYRVVEMEPIGAAIWEDTHLSNTLASIKSQLKNETTVKDVIVLSHNEQVVVALKPYAYDRRTIGDVLSKYDGWFEDQGMNVALLTAPNHYRKAKQMKKNDEMNSEMWESEWGSFFSK